MDGSQSDAVVLLCYAGTGGIVLVLVAVYCVRRMQAEPEPRWYEPDQDDDSKPSKGAITSKPVERARVLSVDSFVLVQKPAKSPKTAEAAGEASEVKDLELPVEEDRLELTEI